MSSPRSFIRLLCTGTLLIAVSGAFLLIPTKQFPDFGFFAWTMLIIFVDVLILRLVFGKLRITLFTVCCLTAYVLLSFGFVISTKIHVLNVLFCFFVLTVLNLNLVSDLFETHMLPRYFYAFFVFLFTKLEGCVQFVIDLSHSIKIFRRRHGTRSLPFHNSLPAVILFLAIGVPVIVIAVTLLSQANPFFAKWIKALIIIDISFSTLFGRFLFFIFAFVYFITEFYFYIRIKHQKEFVPDKQVILSPSFQRNWIIAGIITMVILNLFYLLFIVAELHYDLGNVEGLLAKKGVSSYSRLAVSRFWELIMVSGINLGIMYFLIYPFRQSREQISYSTKYTFLSVSVLLMLNTLLLVLSTWQRLHLYVSGYGFSFSRYMGYSFLPVLAIIVLLVAISFWTADCRKWYSYVFGLCILYFAVIVSLPNDYIINKFNLTLMHRNAIAVYDPLYTIPRRNRNDVMSYDGLPVALQLLREGTHLTPGARQEIDKAIERFQKYSENSTWRSRNFMRMWITSLINKQNK
jgi:hypothetical protein